jgi:hypothetical protein
MPLGEFISLHGETGNLLMPQGNIQLLGLLEPPSLNGGAQLLRSSWNGLLSVP